MYGPCFRKNCQHKKQLSRCMCSGHHYDILCYYRRCGLSTTGSIKAHCWGGQRHLPWSMRRPSQKWVTAQTESLMLRSTRNLSSSSCCRSRSDKDCFHHLTLALHLSLCCESDVQESIFMSLSFRFLLMVSLNRRRGRPLFL